MRPCNPRLTKRNHGNDGLTLGQGALPLYNVCLLLKYIAVIQTLTSSGRSWSNTVYKITYVNINQLKL